MSMELNAAQKSVVEHMNGPLLVVAGAGTGKTKVIIDRLVRLINKGIDKKNILCLTFTEKAAQEMLDRASEELKSEYGTGLSIFTFNGFGAEMLRNYAVEIGLSSNLQLLGDTGKVVFLREHLDELALDYFSPVSLPDQQLPEICKHFSRLKQQLITPEAYLEFAKKLPKNNDAEVLERKKYIELATAFAKYLQLMRTHNLIDYDDQIYLLIELLTKRPNVLVKLQQQFTHLMIDEFQDTNPMQSKLIELLAGERKNLMVVGDDDQSIYGFRGATLANILAFSKEYPDTKEVTLTDNYRSTQHILDGAHKMIQHNNPDRLEYTNKLDKRLLSARGEGARPKVLRFQTLHDELSWVANDIKEKLQTGTPGGEIAVLARRSAIVMQAHQQLEANEIEHNVVGVTNELYQNVMVRTLLEAIKTVANPDDSQALYHTLSGPLFNVQPETTRTSFLSAKKQHEAFFNILQDSKNETVQAAIKYIGKWRSTSPSTNIRSLAYDILVDSGLKDRLLNESDLAKNEQDIQALGVWFASLLDFERIAVIPSASSYLDNLNALQAEGQAVSDDTGAISLQAPSVMTIHKSKGLEWSVVYIIDATEGSMPARNQGRGLEPPEQLLTTSQADEHINEERRLMYVATTRARDELTVTHSATHSSATIRKPSRFIDEFFSRESGQLIESSQSNNLTIESPGTSPKSITLPETMRRGQNIVLTASQADDFLSCPLNFYYKHILCTPEKPTSATAVGSLFHDIIQEVNDARLHGKKVPEFTPLLEKLDTSWPQSGYPSKLQRERAKTYGMKAFEQTYKLLTTGPTPLAVEEPFQVHLPDSRLIIKGRIDVVLPLKDGVEIRDYKTSTSATDAKKAKSKATASKQLVIYALAWRHSKGEDPEVVSLDFVQTGHVGTVKKQSKTLDTMQATLSAAAEDILAGNFAPGYSHIYCIHPPIK